MSDKSSNLASLSSVIKEGIENRLKDLHTALPGNIVDFDPTTQLVSVQPAIKRIFKTINEDSSETTEAIPLPKLINAPLITMRSGGFMVTMPVNVGDECLILFCERALDNWYRTGKVSTPINRRFHSLSDAIVIVGLNSSINPISNYKNDAVEIRNESGNISFTISDNGAMRMQNIAGFVELQSDGQFNINGVIFDTHFHSQGIDSANNVEQDTNGPQS